MVSLLMGQTSILRKEAPKSWPVLFVGEDAVRNPSYESEIQSKADTEHIAIMDHGVPGITVRNRFLLYMVYAVEG